MRSLPIAWHTAVGLLVLYYYFWLLHLLSFGDQSLKKKTTEKLEWKSRNRLIEMQKTIQQKEDPSSILSSAACWPSCWAAISGICWPRQRQPCLYFPVSTWSSVDWRVIRDWSCCWHWFWALPWLVTRQIANIKANRAAQKWNYIAPIVKWMPMPFFVIIL